MVKKIIFILCIFSLFFNSFATENNFIDLNLNLDLSSDNSILKISPGVYISDNTKIDITKNLHILGYGAIIELDESCSTGSIFKTSRSNLKVTFEGFEIKGNGCDTNIFDFGDVEFEEINFINIKVSNIEGSVARLETEEINVINSQFINVQKGFSIDRDSKGLYAKFEGNFFTNEDWNSVSSDEYGEAIELNSHRDGEAIITNNFISGFRENSIDGNIGRMVATGNIIYGVCSENRPGGVIVHGADSSSFSSGDISNNLIFNVPKNQRGIQLLGYLGSTDYKIAHGNFIEGCSGGSSSQFGITSSGKVNNAVITNNIFSNLRTGVQINSDNNNLVGNQFIDVNTHFDEIGNANFRLDSVIGSFYQAVTFYDIESNPLTFARRQALDEVLSITIDDRDVIFKSEQDEDTSTSGGFAFVLDDDGNANPDFKIESKSGFDSFQVYANGNIYTEGSRGYSGSCPSTKNLIIKNGLITDCR